MIITIVILLLVIIVLSVIIWNLNSQINQFEKVIKDFDDKETKLYVELENYYKVFLGLFTEAYTTMKRIDKNGAFSSDDEVGFSFKVILGAIQTVTEKLENLKTEE